MTLVVAALTASVDLILAAPLHKVDSVILSGNGTLD